MQLLVQETNPSAGFAKLPEITQFIGENSESNILYVFMIAQTSYGRFWNVQIYKTCKYKACLSVRLGTTNRTFFPKNLMPAGIGYKIDVILTLSACWPSSLIKDREGCRRIDKDTYSVCSNLSERFYYERCRVINMIALKKSGFKLRVKPNKKNTNLK